MLPTIGYSDSSVKPELDSKAVHAELAKQIDNATKNVADTAANRKKRGR